MTSRREINVGNVAMWIRSTAKPGVLYDLKTRMVDALAAIDISGSRQLVIATAAAAASSVSINPPYSQAPDSEQIDVRALYNYIAGVETPTASELVTPASPSLQFDSSNKRFYPLTLDPFAAVVAAQKLRVYSATDAANNAEFTVASVARRVAPDIQTVGTGLSDLTAGGTYSGSTFDTFLIEIDATGTPDTFQWNKNGGAYTTGVAVTGSAQTLSDGVTVTFAATTGHTLADVWAIRTPVVPTLTETVTARTADTAPLVYMMTVANLIKHNRVETLATLLAAINLRFA